MNYKTVACLFGGIGGGSAGLLKSQVEYGGNVYRYKLLCSIDSDPIACTNHDLITGEQKAVVMDLFRRWQYIDWHGHEPTDDWREMTPWDIWKAFGYQVPSYLFSSPPCKGLSGLLPQGKASSKKYQALNYLTLSGLELALEACEQYGKSVPAVIQLENVPRITSRGKSLLKQIKQLLVKYGYVVSIRADHNLGEIGGLGQNRVRFLIMARHEEQMPNVIYYPERKPLRSIGDVLESLPTPGDMVAGGPLHRLPRLQWKTWMRLSLIPPGGDWRDLNKVDYQNLRVVHEPRSGAFEVADWNKSSRAVTSTAGPGRSNGVTAISDPRLNISGEGKTNILRIQRVTEPSVCVTGAAGPNQGATCISDPRVNTKLHPDSYGVQDWDRTAKTIRSANRIMQAAGSISDPRIADRPGRYTDKFRMQDASEPAGTVTGVTDVQSGAQLLADPRIKSTPRADTMGVQGWDHVGKTVIGSADVHAAAAAVADPRIPADNEQGVWIIIAQDGTWHRPLTTYELAMLQSFPTHLPDGRPFQLVGCSDAKAREYIGNAVPRDAAIEMGNVVLLAIAHAEAGIGFEMTWNQVWIAPLEEIESVVVH
ncbi:DNA cytosine methyltransferase [Paenibacillus agilis]|uniref:DNA cytosine methyltransferase n=1 Tax=Paenibacillus agilis TaxID=3020863 RepID=A0A559IDC1_9BACL|nr:DNA cytosine methyltransferase [Paenibacillus agilis]